MDTPHRGERGEGGEIYLGLNWRMWLNAEQIYNDLDAFFEEATIYDITLDTETESQVERLSLELARLLGDPTTPRAFDDSVHVAKAAQHFALMIADHLMDETPTLGSGLHFGDIPDAQKTARLVNRVEGFLSDNVWLEHLVEKYLPTFSIGGLYGDLARQVAGLTFMVVDATAHAKHRIAHEDGIVDKFIDDLDKWNGSVS